MITLEQAFDELESRKYSLEFDIEELAEDIQYLKTQYFKIAGCPGVNEELEKAIATRDKYLDELKDIKMTLEVLERIDDEGNYDY